MSLTRHIPNALTCANLICGCIGILAVFHFPQYPTAYFIWAACVFDFFDGFVARLLKVSSPIGKELDSLADVVSFGVLPAMAMFHYILQINQPFWIGSIALLIAVFSALRLAKFNIDENQKDSFIGLPTPANALFLTSLVFLPEFLRALVFTTPVLVGITLVFSFLLVSPIELFALKFKNFSWAENKIRFTFLILSVLLLLLLQAGALPFIILLYVLFSLTKRVVNWGS